MTPAPSTRHQTVTLNLVRLISTEVRGTACRCFVAPTDVVFSEHDVVQPDVFVVCDRAKITEANIQGAPDLVIEVVSPSTGLKDKREKRHLYEKFGVREYLLVDPALKSVERFALGTDALYGRGDIRANGDAASPLRRRLTINLQEVFED